MYDCLSLISSPWIWRWTLLPKVHCCLRPERWPKIRLSCERKATNSHRVGSQLCSLNSRNTYSYFNNKFNWKYFYIYHTWNLPLVWHRIGLFFLCVTIVPYVYIHCNAHNKFTIPICLPVFKILKDYTILSFLSSAYAHLGWQGLPSRWVTQDPLGSSSHFSPLRALWLYTLHMESTRFPKTFTQIPTHLRIIPGRDG